MKRPWEIQFYETETGTTPVLDFIRSLPKSERVKVGHAIDDLEQLGTSLRMPHARPIVSQEDLFELRVTGEANRYRVFYFHYTGKVFVLLHAFVKKTQKTPDKEIKTAMARLKDYKERIKE